MKRLLQLTALGLALVAFGPSPPAPAGDAESTPIELACKPRGSTCRSSFECCSQKCQPANGIDTCH